jgi:hypothetical protein
MRDDLPPRLRIVRMRISTALLTEMAIERTRHQVGAWSWWTYLLGDAWHFEARLVDMRAQALR